VPPSYPHITIPDNALFHFNFVLFKSEAKFFSGIVISKASSHDEGDALFYYLG
jgi:hypothetical protein